MPQIAIPAVYMRGGTSRALVFHRHDLPPVRDGKEPVEWNDIFLAAIGSPDLAERQLDGMGGGISSLSKIAVVSPSERHDADVDFTFAQVGIDKPVVGYRGNCGNIISAIGPFAIDEGLMDAQGDKAVVRIHNTNTGKITVASFPLDGGEAAVKGEFSIQGVATRGAAIRLAFREPGGAVTGRLLPTGNASDVLDLPGGPLRMSLVDAANPTVFVSAQELGLSGVETAAELSANTTLRARLEDLRVAAAVRGAIAASEEEARTRLTNLPLLAILAAPIDHAVPGAAIAAGDIDIVTRMISAGQPHKATPLTSAMCLAVAAAIPGTVAHETRRPQSEGSGDLRIGHATGILPVKASIRHQDAEGWFAEEAVVYRTARRLMKGHIYVPGPQ